jgi:DNA-binding NtrC family response regulator
MSAPASENESNVRRLRPLRVLVAAEDPRFLAVATVVLARGGLVVESTERLGDVVARVERHGLNAVILDATDAVAAAARCAAALERRCPTVKVVVVSEDPAASRTSFATFAKWDAFPAIVAEIGGAAGSGRADHLPPAS